MKIRRFSMLFGLIGLLITSFAGYGNMYNIPNTKDNNEVVFNNNDNTNKAIVTGVFEGEGTENSPFIISDYTLLKNFSNYIASSTQYASGMYYDNAYYKLDADLTLDSDFISIGASSLTVQRPFKGHFDGDNHKITYTNTIGDISAKNETRGFGLFAACMGATIKNIDLDITLTTNLAYVSSAYIIGIGGLVGIAQSLETTPSSFSNITCNSNLKIVYNSTNINSNHGNLYLGGLVGETYGSTIWDNIKLTSKIDCLTSQTVEVKYGYLYVGGSYGNLEGNTTITNSSFKTSELTIGGNSNLYFSTIVSAGGFIGNADSESQVTNLSVSNCSISVGKISYSLSQIQFDRNYFGLVCGEMGYFSSATVANYNFYRVNIEITEDASLKVYSASTSYDVKISVMFAGVNKSNINLINTTIAMKGFAISNFDTSNNLLLSYGNYIGEANLGNTVVVSHSYIYQTSGAITTTGLVTSQAGLLARINNNDIDMTFNDSYIYVDNSATGHIVYSSGIYSAGSGALTLHITDTSLSNVEVTIFEDFSDDKLASMNESVADYNSDTLTPSYYWTLSIKNGKYPTFAIKVTAKAQGFDDRTIDVSVIDHSYDNTILNYDGYDTDGIYEDAGFTTVLPNDFFTTLSEDTTIYVKLTEVVVEPEEPATPTIPYGEVFNIIYNTKDGTINDTSYPTTYVCGVGATLPVSVTKVNYDFIGWSTRNLSGVIITHINNRQYGDVYLNANYKISDNATKYTITYIDNGGIIGESYLKDYLDEEVTLPTKVTLNHATFDGWYEAKDFSGNRIYKINKGDTGNKTYYAKYVYEVYSITYYLNNGAIGESYTTSYHYGEEITLPTIVNEDGYTFLGFSLKENDSNNLVTRISSDDYGNKTFYAVYKENTDYSWLLWLGLGALVVILGTVISIVSVKKHKKAK